MNLSASAHVERVREAGDSALLLEIRPAAAVPPSRAAIDETANVLAIGIAAAVRRRNIPGVRDVVPTFHSVAVFFDPLSTDVAAVAAALHELGSDSGAGVTHEVESPRHRSPTPLQVPVAYGGEFGPDLDEVAAFAGCSPQAVIDRHCGRTYRVCMLGFLPGFAYMASVDERIAMPRRAAPRLRVAAGSVGIAGLQTAIYPRESPGGWRIIGRTPVSLFDPNHTRPGLFSPGDHVQFVPVTEASRLGGESSPDRHRGPEGPAPAGHAGRSARHLAVLRPGFLTTVQDAGRWGYQDRGVSVSGPMDSAAHRLANVIVGNPPGAATLEATLVGPDLRFEQDTVIAIGGADLHAIVDGSEIPRDAPVPCRAGSVLRFGGRRSGTRAYVAVDGGIVVPPVLGSRATHLLSGLGGIEGRAARAGDRIPIGEPAHAAGGADAKVRLHRMHHDLIATVNGGARLRILPGPQADYFLPDALDRLQRARFVVSPQSDRVGYRLTGGLALTRVADVEMMSDVAFPGAVQVPPSGKPILLMADRQTTGGYPQVAIVISADLPRAAQLAPGDWVEFEACTRAEAIAALIDQEGRLLAAR